MAYATTTVEKCFRATKKGELLDEAYLPAGTVVHVGKIRGLYFHMALTPDARYQAIIHPGEFIADE